MRKAFAAATVALLLAGLAPVTRGDTSALQIVSVPVTSRAEVQLLFEHFDETHNHSPGEVELLLWPGDRARLDALGFDYTVVVEDVIARDRRLASQPKRLVSLPGPDRDDYRRLEDYETEMHELAEQHPRMVRLLELPLESLEGRPVFGLEIAARVNRSDGRPMLYVDGLHHAREWPAGEYTMIFAHYLLDRFRKDARVTRLLRRGRVLLVPVVNPDGFDYSRESPVQAQGLAGTALAIAGAEAYWRKNRRSFSGATVPVIQRNPDAYGVDPNRNYGFRWGDSRGGSSGQHFNQTYRGEEPYSEPEVENVRRLLMRRNPTMVITNHTYSELVLRPWGDVSEDAPDERVLASLGARMARAMGGYQNIKAIQLYPTTGTTQDWAYGNLAALSYTYEHGRAFHPPFAGSVGEAWRGVMEAFMISGDAAINPSFHAVVTGRVVDGNGNPVRARLRLTKRIPTTLGQNNPYGEDVLPERFNASIQTSAGGSFRWHVNPSTRPEVQAAGGREAYRLTVSAPGHGNKTFRIVVGRGDRRHLGTIRL
jgi:hypothetical protein